MELLPGLLATSPLSSSITVTMHVKFVSVGLSGERMRESDEEEEEEEVLEDVMFLPSLSCQVKKYWIMFVLSTVVMLIRGKQVNTICSTSLLPTTRGPEGPWIDTSGVETVSLYII